MAIDSDLKATRLIPLHNPTVRELRNIPIGSEVLYIDWDDESVTCHVWEEDTVDVAVTGPGPYDDDSEVEGTFVYLPLGTVTVRTANEVIDALTSNKDWQALDERQRYMALVQAARLGMVEQPF